MGKMKKLLFSIYMALVALFCAGCEIKVEYETIPFVVNDVYYSLLQNDKVVKGVYYSQSSFEKDFKPAIAGAGSMDKLADFESSFVVTVTGVSSETRRSIEIVEVLKKDMTLHIKYKIIDGEKTGAKMRPCVVASISRNYTDCDIAFHDISDWE